MLKVYLVNYCGKSRKKNSLLAEEMTLKYKFLIFPADENSGVYQGFFIFAKKGTKNGKEQRKL